MNDPTDRAQRSLARLLDIMRRLRDPQGGCPWDREQDFASIAPYTIEEAYEVAEAIARGEPVRIEAELGDLLFQVVFHAQMGGERDWFDFASVADAISDKLTERHPHVFGDAEIGSAAEQNRAWEEHKARERAARDRSRRRSELADVPLALPALARAAKLGKRAGTRRLRLAGCARRARQDRRGAARDRRAPAADAAARGGTRRPVVRDGELGAASRRRIRKRPCDSRMPSSNGAFAPWNSSPRSAGSQLAQLDAADLGCLVERGQKERKNQRIRRSVGIHRPLRTVPPRSRMPADGGLCRARKKMMVGLMVAAFTVASAGAFAQDALRPGPYDDRRYDRRRYDDRPTTTATAPTTTPRWSTCSR